MDGILVIDKPAGPTSHDVVSRVKRMIGARKVGHLGTLDPAATGVLPLCINAATKKADELSGGDKVYSFTLRLGAVTDTDDAEGELLEEHHVEKHHLDRLPQVVQTFVGEIDQVPPRYSARKVNGRRLYKMARKGVEVSAPPRKILIHELAIETIEGSSVAMKIRCGKGTYVRALCRDIGRVLGCGGHAADIRRLQSGRFSILDAITIDELNDTWEEKIISYEAFTNRTAQG